MAGVKGQRSGGHNAKTAQEHRLSGTFRRGRHAGARGPELVAGDPTPPKTLHGDARAEWARMLEALRAAKSLSQNDYAALYQYTKLFGQTEVLEAQLDRLAKREAHFELVIERLQDEGKSEAVLEALA